MTPAKFRTVARWFQIFVAISMGACFFSPLSRLDWSLPLIKYALFPLLLLSGLAMWKQAKVMKWLNIR